MHIVYVIAPGGGPEAYVKTLLPYLEAQGHRVSVVYIANVYKQHHTFPKHIRVVYVSAGSLHYYLYRFLGDSSALHTSTRSWELAINVYGAIRRIHHEYPVNVVEVTEGIPLYFVQRRWPIVLRAHGSSWTFRYFCKDKLIHPSLIKQESLALRHADIVSPISDHLAQHLSSSFAYPRDKIQSIPYPIDTHQFVPGGEYAEGISTPSVLCVGRFEHRKGTDILMRALPYVWKSFPDLHLYLIGNESQYTRQDLLDFIPINKHAQVSFLGFVPHENLPMFYRASTIYVAPTQYETFGYTILEAMACGLPIISCNVGAIPELVQDGVHGSLVPFGDPMRLATCLIELLGNSVVRDKMGENSRKKALFYELEKIAPKLVFLYLEAEQRYLER